MELDASLSWLALALPPVLACRLCARLLRKIGSPDRIFHASLTELESCSLPARAPKAIHNKDAFKRAEKELAGIRNIPGCRLLNWTEPEYPQTLLQIYDPPVLFYLRGDPQILNMPCLEHRRDEAAHSVWFTNGGAPGSRSGSARAGNP